MKRFAKVMIAGAVIMGIGLAILIAALAVGGGNFQDDYEIKTYECSEENVSLDIDFSIGKLDVDFYDGEKIKIEYPENKLLSASVKESSGKLSFKTDYRRKLNLFRWLRKIPATKIWIPQGPVMNVKINMDAGEAKFADGEYGDFNLYMNAGSFEMNDADCVTLSVTLNAGAVDMNSVSSVEDVKFQVNAGKIDIDSLNCPYVVTDVNAGDVSVDKMQVPKVDVDISAGSVKFGIVGNRAEYNILVDKSAGKCNISNQKGTMDKYINADISAGSLNVDFES